MNGPDKPRLIVVAGPNGAGKTSITEQFWAQDSFGFAVSGGGTVEQAPPASAKPKRFHGTALLDTARVGRDASRIAEEVISHLSGLMGASVRVTIEIEADIPAGASDQIVRIVTENSRTLKFSEHGFEKE